MYERSTMFQEDFIPNLRHQGSLEMIPEDSYNIGNHFNSLVTHKTILPGPKEMPQVLPRFILRAYIDRERVAEDMLWGEKAAERGLYREDWKNYQKADVNKYALKSALLDYVVPGYTGHLRRPAVGVVDLIDPSVLTAIPKSNISQHEDTVQKYGIEPVREILPIYPKVRMSKGCRRML